MKRSFFLFSIIFLVSCGGGGGGEEYEYEYEYEKRYSYEDYYEDEYEYGPLHFQGLSCAACHYFAGGTVFKELHAPDYDVSKAARGYRVKLVFQNGNVYIANYGRGAGNFIIPKRNLQDNFTAVVIDRNGREVNSSLPYSHTPDRFDCAACHTQYGVNGAPGRIVNYNYYESTSQ